MKIIDAILYRTPGAAALRATQIAEAERMELECRATAEAHAAEAANQNALADMYAARRERLFASIDAVRITEPGLMRRMFGSRQPIALGDLHPGVWRSDAGA